jgi:hypothetical protein
MCLAMMPQPLAMNRQPAILRSSSLRRVRRRVAVRVSTAAAVPVHAVLGQTLRPPLSDPTGSAIVSTNSEYQLGIYYNARTQTSGGVGLEIGQFSPVVGAGLWTQGGRATPQAYAVMRRSGNFVL